MPSVATRGKDIVGDLMDDTSLSLNDEAEKHLGRRHHDGWIQFGREGYEISKVYKNSAVVMDRKKE